MAESLVCSAESKASDDGSSSSCLIRRRIEFCEARNGCSGFLMETLNPSENQQRFRFMNQYQSGLIGKKVDGAEFLGSELDPELSFRITFRRIGAGLQNLGNTCFLNSVLQCLTYTEPLAAYLQSGKHQNSCRINGFCALCAIQKHVSCALQSTGRILAPNHLVSNLRRISRNFQKSRQEDAHECMVSLLESMHKCCLPSGVPSESPRAYEKSLVHKIFGGYLQSQVKCMECSYFSNSFDPFLDLSLDIANVESLQRALWNFTAAEQIDGGEKLYNCQQCKKKVRALKQLTVHKAPYVLTIHLKRFLPHDPGEKIDKNVHFGPTLDLEPFVSGSHKGNLKYTLYGVLVHLGWTTHTGHYYCFVRTSSGMWYSLDDNKVVQVSEKTVLKQKAYMLFYVGDRKNVSSSKAVAIKNMNANVNGNKACLSVNQVLHEPSPNGETENRLRNGASPAVVNQKDAPSDGSTKDSLLNETSVKPNNASLEVESSLPKWDNALEPSLEVAVLTGPVLQASLKIPSSLDPPNELSVLNSKLGKLSLPSDPSVNGNSMTADTIYGSIISDNNKKESSSQDVSDSVSITPNLSDSVVISLNCKGHQGSAILENKISQKIVPNSNTGILSMSPQSVPSDKTSKKTDLVQSIPNETAACNSLKEDVDGSKKLKPDDLVEVSSLPIVTNRSAQKDCTTHRKSKKKLLRCPFASMHLGSNILFRAFLGLRKKKTHKSNTRHSLRMKRLCQKPLLDKHHVLSDLGPSTSEESISIPSSSEQMTGQNGAVLASGKQLTEVVNSLSAANQSDSREPDSSTDGKRDRTQNGFRSMLTRGVDKSTVAHWDGIELSSAQVGESNHETFSIGYVPDEWDEEYDRGKRKKVRHPKPKFGGNPNPFQEIATMKTQWKKAKMEHCSSGNQPFRI